MTRLGCASALGPPDPSATPRALHAGACPSGPFRLEAQPSPCALEACIFCDGWCEDPNPGSPRGLNALWFCNGRRRQICATSASLAEGAKRIVVLQPPRASACGAALGAASGLRGATATVEPVRQVQSAALLAGRALSGRALQAARAHAAPACAIEPLIKYRRIKTACACMGNARQPYLAQGGMSPRHHL